MATVAAPVVVATAAAPVVVATPAAPVTVVVVLVSVVVVAAVAHGIVVAVLAVHLLLLPVVADTTIRATGVPRLNIRSLRSTLCFVGILLSATASATARFSDPIVLLGSHSHLGFHGAVT